MALDIEFLKEETISMLNALSVPKYEEVPLTNGTSYHFVIKEFGIIICVLRVVDIVFVRNKVAESFKNWRVFFLTTDDDLIYKKDELLFELMRCGYMKWIRLSYPRQFDRVIKLSELGNKIIKKRLEVWAERPKYSFLIEDNKDALQNPTSYVLSLDPSFFDYMPEGEN